MWWNVSNPYCSFGKRASKEKHSRVGRKTILTVRLKFGRIWIVEVKRYHSRPGRPSVTNPARHPPRRARSVKIWESGSAWLGPVSLLWRTRPGTPHGEPGRWKSRSPGVPGWARSAFCDGPELRHKRTSPRLVGQFCHRKCRGRFCRWIKMQNCRVRQTHAQTTWINIVDLEQNYCIWHEKKWRNERHVMGKVTKKVNLGSLNWILEAQMNYLNYVWTSMWNNCLQPW
jgi:hypothetical protein